MLLLADAAAAAQDGFPLSAGWTAAGVAALGSGIIGWLLKDRSDLRADWRADRAALDAMIAQLHADAGKLRDDSAKAIVTALGAHMDDIRRFSEKTRETLDNLARVIAVSRRQINGADHAKSGDENGPPRDREL